jgi:GT2 family glycosyltransferase
MGLPEVSAVLVHHLGMENLREAVAALTTAFQGISGEVLVVDNTGGRSLETEISRWAGVRRVPAPGNVGFAAGCRLGAEAASSPILLFVNDDAAVEPDAPPLLASALRGAPDDVVAVGGRLTDWTGSKNDFSDGFLTFDGHAFAADVGLPVDRLPAAAAGEERLFACGGLMAVRRREFLESPFDEDYFAYLEDVDFGWRQWIFGRRILAEPRAVARHRGGATGEALGVFARGFLFEKNAFATVYKNLDEENFRALMPAVLAAFVGRLSEMLATRNPRGRELERDPYREPERASPSLRRLFGISELASQSAVLDDPLTIAQARALLWIRRHEAALAEKRARVQARRRRADREIFAKFPLRIVPTYPGDERFDSDFFRAFLAGAPPLTRMSLSEIFR